MRLGHAENQVPVAPGAFRKLSRSGLLQGVLELFVAERAAQGFHVTVRSDIHDLSNQAVAILESAFRRLPPDVLASDG